MLNYVCVSLCLGCRPPALGVLSDYHMWAWAIGYAPKITVLFSNLSKSKYTLIWRLFCNTVFSLVEKYNLWIVWYSGACCKQNSTMRPLHSDKHLRTHTTCTRRLLARYSRIIRSHMSCHVGYKTHLTILSLYLGCGGVCSGLRIRPLEHCLF